MKSTITILIILLALVSCNELLRRHHSKHKHTASHSFRHNAVHRNELRKMHAEHLHTTIHRTHSHSMRHITKHLARSEIMSIAKSRKNLKKLQTMNKKMKRAQYLTKLYATSNALISMGLRSKAFFNDETEKKAAKIVDAIQKHYNENHNQDTVQVNESDCANRKKLVKLLNYTQEIWKSVQDQNYDGAELKKLGNENPNAVTPQEKKDWRKQREIEKVQCLVESIKQLRLLYENANSIKRMDVLKGSIEELQIDAKQKDADSLDYARIQLITAIDQFLYINSLPEDNDDYKLLRNPIDDASLSNYDDGPGYKGKEGYNKKFSALIKKFKEIFHQYNVKLSHQTIEIKKAFQEPFKKYVDKTEDEEEDEIKKLWDTSDLPNFCWNAQIKIPNVCPPEFPERKGVQCWAKCNNKLNEAKHLVPYIGTSKRVVYFERDFAGTCWETCLDPNTMTTFPGCKVGVFTIDTDYPNNEWHVKRSYVNLEKDQSKNNFAEDIKCQPGQIRTTWAFMPFCKYADNNPHTCNSMGYENCGIACAKDKVVCATEITNMVSKTLVGIAKFASLLGVPGASVFTQIGDLSKQALPYLTKIYDVGLSKLDEISEFKKIMTDPDTQKMIRNSNGDVIISQNYLINRLFTKVAFTAKKHYLKKKLEETSFSYQNAMKLVWDYLLKKYNDVKDLKEDNVKNQLLSQKADLTKLKLDIDQCDLQEHKKWTLLTPKSTGVSLVIEGLAEKGIDSAQEAVIERLKTEATHLSAKDKSLLTKEQYKNSKSIQDQIKAEKEQFDKTAEYTVDDNGLFTSVTGNFEQAQKIYNDQVSTFLGSDKKLKIVEWGEDAQKNYDQKMRELKDTVKKYNLELVFQGMQVAYNLKGLYDIGKNEDGLRDQSVTDQEIASKQRTLIKSTFEMAAKTDPTGIYDILAAYIYDDCFSAQDLGAQVKQLEEEQTPSTSGDQYLWTIQNIRWEEEFMCSSKNRKLQAKIQNKVLYTTPLDVECGSCKFFDSREKCKVEQQQARIDFKANQNDIIEFEITSNEKSVKYRVPLKDFRDVKTKTYKRTVETQKKDDNSKMIIDIVNQSATEYKLDQFTIKPQKQYKYLALRVIGPLSQMTYQLSKFGRDFKTAQMIPSDANSQDLNAQQYNEKFTFRLDYAEQNPKIKFELWSQDYVNSEQRRLLQDGEEEGERIQSTEVNLDSLLGSSADHIAQIGSWLTLSADSNIPEPQPQESTPSPTPAANTQGQDFTTITQQTNDKFQQLDLYITSITNIPVVKLKHYIVDVSIKDTKNTKEISSKYWLVTFVVDQDPTNAVAQKTLDSTYYSQPKATDKQVQFTYGGLKDYSVAFQSYPWKFQDAAFDYNPMIQRCELHEGKKCRKIGLIAYPECEEGYKASSTFNPYKCNVDPAKYIYDGNYKYSESFHASEVGRIKKIIFENPQTSKKIEVNYPAGQQFENYAKFDHTAENFLFSFTVTRTDEVISPDE